MLFGSVESVVSGVSQPFVEAHWGLGYLHLNLRCPLAN